MRTRNYFWFLGVYLLIAPEAALPDPSIIWVVPIALIAPIFYGLEGNFVAKFGTGNNSPIEVLLGAPIPDPSVRKAKTGLITDEIKSPVRSLNWIADPLPFIEVTEGHFVRQFAS